MEAGDRGVKQDWVAVLLFCWHTKECVMAEETVHITVRPNGPLRVEGHIVLKDADGREWDLTGKPAISLCRCGLSDKRPFCDGAHGRNGWVCETAPPVNLT
jgi:CDGSH-type Zn-finger protein